MGRRGVTAPSPDESWAILVVDDDGEALGRVARELERRYGADYRIVTTGDPLGALDRLEVLRREDREVALVLADHWMPGLNGTDLLLRVARLYPHAKRGLMIDFGAWGDESTARAILRAMAVGEIDYYVLKPWRSPDELFNRTIAEFLHEWARVRPSGPREVVVVGPEGHERTHEVRSLLSRNGIPFVGRREDEPDGRDLLARAGVADCRAPVVGFHDGRVLVDPSNIEIAQAFGFRTTIDRADVDVLIVGAGPAGFAAAVYAASEGLETLVVERETIGGQAGSSSLIRNYLGFPRGISGAELAMRAFQQAWVFGASVLMMREVAELRDEEGRVVVSLTDGQIVRARAVVLAMGVSYRRLEIPSLEALNGAGVLRRLDRGGASPGGRRRDRPRGRELGRSGGDAPLPLRAHGDDRRAGRLAGGQHVALPDPPDRRGAEHRGALRPGGGGWRRKRASRGGRAAAARGR